MAITRVTTKGQVTIPHGIRSAMDIQAGDGVVFVMEGSRIVLVPVKRKRLSELHGVLRPSQSAVDFAEARRTYRREVARHVVPFTDDDN